MSNPTELPDLDRGYFKRKLATIVRDLSSYTAPEMARELARLAQVADEIEFAKEARRAQPEGEAPQADMAQLPPGLEFDGYHDSDEHYGKTILDLVRSRLEVDPDELQEGDVFYVSASWVQPQEWRVVRAGNPLEVERISPPAAPAATSSPLCGAQHAESGKESGSIGDLTEFHILLNWYDNEASYGSINEGRNKLTEYIDKWAARRAAQLDGGQEESESNG